MRDNWILRDGLCKPLGLKPGLNIHKVSDLFTPGTKQWDVQLVRTAFYDMDVNDIVKIKVPSWKGDDVIAWRHTKSGTFSVRSAYHLQKAWQKNFLGPSSSNTESHRGWKILWKANVQNKMKVHAWRLIQNGLAVGDELTRRKIKEGVKCIFCQRGESVMHRFWGCSYSQWVWRRVEEKLDVEFPVPSVECNSHHVLAGWFLDRMVESKDYLVEGMLVTIYNIWLARNDAQHAPNPDSPDGVAARILVQLEEWANLSRKQLPTVQNPACPWRRPDAGWIKANSDGAFVANGSLAAVGVVLRDHDGQFKAAATQHHAGVESALLAEILACSRAVDLAMEMGTEKLLIESDSLEVIRLLSQKEIDRSEYGLASEEVKRKLSGLRQIRLQWIRRSANAVAHRLAQEGLALGGYSTWLAAPPSFILNVLDEDFRNSIVNL